ncbi:MAG: sporulation initiation factor Spo0A C-terminal domain-containing protein [Oscillospiraceae bacterium]|jgi:hypothetical protein|nr:sporulation initiation factor Spo0A C-terminal domain-containing protein [Oscillospiraceae bacterium]
MAKEGKNYPFRELINIPVDINADKTYNIILIEHDRRNAAGQTLNAIYPAYVPADNARAALAAETGVSGERDGLGVLRMPREEMPPLSPRENIFNICLMLGIPPHTRGSLFLRESIMEVIKNRDVIHDMVKTLYPTVARKFDTSPSRVERAIRHAIETAWARGKIENVNVLFGHAIYGKADKPTNGELIALIADRLLIQNGPEQA